MKQDIDGCSIGGNNHALILLDWNQLTPKEQKDFDYLDTEDAQASASFFRYRDNVYSLDEFEQCHPTFRKAGFDGQISDSHCSGVLVKLGKDEDYEADYIRVYTFCS